MRVLLDDNVPGLQALLAGVVDVTTMNGRDIDGRAAAGFDALLCRSQTFVNAVFLEDAQGVQGASRDGPHGPRFVATATSGTDHIDTDLLAAQAITFASAHGSNAVSVADYVLAAVARHCLDQQLDVRQLRFGVVGRGAVGATLCARLTALGCPFVVSDPPLAARDGGADTPLMALADQDVTSLHVPLLTGGVTGGVTGGSWPTRHLIDASWLAASRPGSLLINAARGGVVDEAAWCNVLDAGRHAVIDTWDREPRVFRPLAERARLVTTHIAGHSLDAKLDGTRMVAEAFARFAGVQLDFQRLAAELPAQPVRRVCVDSLADVYGAVAAGYNIEADDAALRALLPMDDAALGRGFDDYRRRYPIRRDFAVQPLVVDGSPELVELLYGFGFARA